MTVRLHQRALERLVDNLRSDTMADLEPDVLRLPASQFVDTVIAERERKLMRTLPLVVGHGSELAARGDFITRVVLGTPVILVRRDDGVAGGYLNMCRHRGAIVETHASGNQRLFSCRYHGWSYERDSGQLRNIPFDDTFGTVDRACHNLVPIEVEERHGLLWIVIEPSERTSVDRYLGAEIESQFDDFGLHRSVLFQEENIGLEFNWKLVMDGAIDVLHLKFLHPHGVAKFLVTGRACFDKYGRHGQNFTPRKRLEQLALAGNLPPIEDVWRYMSTNILLYPNSMCIKAPDHFELWTVWPDERDPLKCSVTIRFLVLPEVLTDEIADRIRRSWAVLRQAATEEDFPTEASIQRNAVANGNAMFTYGRNERSIRHLHQSLAADISAMQ